MRNSSRAEVALWEIQLFAVADTTEVMSTEGRTVRVPGAVKKLLLADEQVLAVIKQSRLPSHLTPS
jgi:hypothetical protein